MGASASFQLQPEDVQFDVYKELKTLYDNELNPKVTNGELPEHEVYRTLRIKFEALAREKIENNLSPEILEFVRALSATKATNENPYQRSATLPYDSSSIMVGDIVKAKVDNLYFEAVVVEVVDDIYICVDFGDCVEKVRRDDCYIILHSADIEIGDTVEVKSLDQCQHCTGEVVAFNLDGTVNVKMRSDDSDEDVEMYVKMSNIRKIMTNRQMSTKLDFHEITTGNLNENLDIYKELDMVAETSEEFDADTPLIRV